MRNKYIDILFSGLILLMLSWAFWSINSVISIVTLFTFLLIGWKILRRKSITITISDIIVMMYVFYETYSCYSSEYRPNSMLFLIKILIILLLYFIARNFIKRNMLFAILVFFSFYFMIINLLEILFFLVHYLRIAYYEFIDLTQFRNLFMPFGIYSNEWVSNLFLMLLFPLSLYIYIITIKNSLLAQNWDKRITVLIRSNYFFAGIILTINIILFNILISFSRGAYISAAVLFFASIIFFIINRRRFSFIVIFKYVSWVFILPFIGGIMLKQPVQSTILLHSSVSQNRSSVGRMQLWEKSLQIFKDSPYNGVGTNNFALNYNSLGERGTVNFTGKISNSYLQLLVEKGIIGIVVYLILFFAFVYFSFYFSNIKKTSLLEKIFLTVSVFCVTAFLIREITFSSFFFSDGILIQTLIIYLLVSVILFSNKPLFAINIKMHAGFIMIITILIISFYIHRTLQDQKYYYKFKNEFDKKQFNISLPLIEKISTNNPDNSYYTSCKILNIVRQYESDNFNIHSLNSHIITDFNINYCIDLYKKALKRNPHDGNFHHNLAWLYFFCKNYVAALYHIDMAIKIENGISAYYISAGIMREYLEDQHTAMRNFSKAISLSPDLLDSKFWKDMNANKPEMAEKIIKEVAEQLKESEDPIDLAIKAKLYIYSNNLEKAKEILITVTKSLPNLSRPWYNLGYLYNKQNDFDNMIRCYNNSLLMDPFYYMTCFKLAQYYEENGKISESIQNYKATLRYWDYMSTEHSQRCKKIYFVDGVRNDLIPKGLLIYIKPYIEKSTIESKI
ncbi:MAG: O-antigen ligase family protein [Bacteroidales bacterium]|nr:O-antigen ligase family protein [Bacteroidales bacterium]